ncbi:ArsR/SmtB family transcription factor [Herpetosiphon llansteffanensis]|uniref:ArsR/SmtB family transcription factor n=1 Tax=Herpetosiphon llansteffanensis TaxID=2094568 RepID=UPI000D7C345A|nr:metalloregulator ArsR/SmtB family transcription factor [Herpetosiphon llansteffanensis]
MEQELVFRALADPTRRQLLDLLFERDGRTLKELESAMPMTRFGVMKHLRVLEEAGLIVTRKVGRERLHYLNPVPIQLISDRWMNKYAANRAMALIDLKMALEGGSNSMTSEAKPKLVYQTIIKASQQQVWDAITKPEFTSRYYYGCTVETTLEVGSPFNYQRSNGAPIVEGEVLVADAPNRLVHSYHSLWAPMNADAPTKVTWELEAMPNGITKVTVVHEDFEGETATYQGLNSGGWTWILSNLKTVLETGDSLPEQY